MFFAFLLLSRVFFVCKWKFYIHFQTDSLIANFVSGLVFWLAALFHRFALSGHFCKSKWSVKRSSTLYLRPFNWNWTLEDGCCAGVASWRSALLSHWFAYLVPLRWSSVYCSQPLPSIIEAQWTESLFVRSPDGDKSHSLLPLCTILYSILFIYLNGFWNLETWEDSWRLFYSALADSLFTVMPAIYFCFRLIAIWITFAGRWKNQELKLSFALCWCCGYKLKINYSTARMRLQSSLGQGWYHFAQHSTHCAAFEFLIRIFSCSRLHPCKLMLLFRSQSTLGHPNSSIIFFLILVRQAIFHSDDWTDFFFLNQ